MKKKRHNLKINIETWQCDLQIEVLKYTIAHGESQHIAAIYIIPM